MPVVAVEARHNMVLRLPMWSQKPAGGESPTESVADLDNVLKALAEPGGASLALTAPAPAPNGDNSEDVTLSDVLAGSDEEDMQTDLSSPVKRKVSGVAAALTSMQATFGYFGIF